MAAVASPFGNLSGGYSLVGVRRRIYSPLLLGLWRTGEIRSFSLVKAGKKPKQDDQSSVFHNGINNPPLIITNGDRPLIKLLVVLLIRVTSGVIQQLLDAPVGKPPRSLGKDGVLSVSLRDRLKRIARHLQPHPAPVFVLVPAKQPAEVPDLRALDLAAFFVAEWVGCHHGHCLPAGQHRLRP